MAAAYPHLSLEQWEGITPVVLPLHSITLSCINLATVGVSIPFFLFLISMFNLLVPIWLENFKSDKLLHENATPGPARVEGGETMMMMSGNSRITKMQPGDFQPMYGAPNEGLLDMRSDPRLSMRGGY